MGVAAVSWRALPPGAPLRTGARVRLTRLYSQVEGFYRGLTREGRCKVEPDEGPPPYQVLRTAIAEVWHG